MNEIFHTKKILLRWVLNLSDEEFKFVFLNNLNPLTRRVRSGKCVDQKFSYNSRVAKLGATLKLRIYTRSFKPIVTFNK